MKNRIKIITFSLFSLTLFVGVKYLSISKLIRKNTHVAKQQPSFAHDNHLTYLKKTEAQVWESLNSLGLNRHVCEEKCKKKIQEYGHERAKKSRDISKSNYDLIKTVLQDFKIDGTQLSIQTWDESSAAGINNNTLFINPKKFDQLSLCSKKFVIGHELQHYIHHDPVMKGIFLDEMPEGAFDNSCAENPLNQFARFKEERADIKTALKSKEYAQGYIEFIQTISRAGDNKGITHPKHSKRLQIGNAILNTFNVC